MRPAVALVVLLAGCPGTTDVADGGSGLDAPPPDAPAGGDATGAPDTGATADGGAPVDASTPADAASDDAAMADAGDVRSGLVSLAQGMFGSSLHSTFATFRSGPIEELRIGLIGTPCTIGPDVGGCRTFTCASGLLDTHDAGELRVDVEGTRIATLATPSPGAGPYIEGGSGPVFAPGDVVHFELTGGVVPAFGADIVAPSPPAIVLPTTIDNAADLVLDWTATGGDTMQIALVASGRGVGCRVPGSDGTLTIDASLLSDFATGSTVTVSASYYATTTLTTGLYTVDVSVAQGLSSVATFE